ncbi:MAG: hypothetical protein MIL41_05050 [Hyphomicrobiales bacterium]
MKAALRQLGALANRFGLIAVAFVASVWMVLSDASPLTGLIVALGFGALSAIEAAAAASGILSRKDPRP